MNFSLCIYNGNKLHCAVQICFFLFRDDVDVWTFMKLNRNRMKPFL